MKKTIFVLVLLAALFCLIKPKVISAQGLGPTSAPTPLPYDPNLISIIQTCLGYQNNQACIYSKDLFMLRLEYGPGTKLPKNGSLLWDYLFEKEEVVAILSHIESDGKKFLKLRPGNFVYFISPDGRVSLYQISSIDTWIDTGRWRTFTSQDGRQEAKGYQLFEKYYAQQEDGYHKMVFQTCTPDNEGVIFIVGQKISP